MNSNPSIGDYLSSPYFIEVVVVFLFGIALYFLVRKGRRIEWEPLSGWRKFNVVVGWLFTALATLTWIALLVLVIGALQTAVENYYPKPASLVFVILGGALFFILGGIGGSAFDVAHGSARGDIRKWMGKEP